MRVCSKCNIKVGGDFQYCPLCQHEIEGEKSDSYFQNSQNLKKKSMVYRIQLFASVAIMIICLFLDHVIGLSGKIHWSNISAFSIIIIQFVLKKLMHRHNVNLYYYLFNLSMSAIFILMIISHYLDFWDFSFSFILPSLLMLLFGSLFALGFIDKTGNGMTYLLAAICGGIIAPAVVLKFFAPDFVMLWQICLMLSLILLTGTIIFKGNKALNELHKRFHM